MVLLRDQHAGKKNNMTGGNKSFEKVEHFTCLGTTLTIKRLFMEKLKAD